MQLKDPLALFDTGFDRLALTVKLEPVFEIGRHVQVAIVQQYSVAR